MNAWLVPLLTGVAGGGATATGITAFAARRRTDAETVNITVEGANGAVEAMRLVLQSETEARERAERRLAEKERIIEVLENRIADMACQLEQLRDEVHQLRLMD